MIISASRRTDIPAFYAKWMIRRIQAGYCTVPNPFNRHQVSRISLRPDDVTAIVFWTRNPLPLLAHCPELDERGYWYYFQFTILGYPREIDPKSPPADVAIRAFAAVSERLGPERVIWRYDPVLFSGLTTPAFHEENFGRLAQRLRGLTQRVVVSVLDVYRKAEHRLNLLRGGPAEIVPADETTLQGTMRTLADIARANGLEIVSCAEEIDLQPCGIRPGRCIDDGLIRVGCGQAVPKKKDPSQRKACGCVVSRDIGMYDSCLYLCPYCYATQSFSRARENFEQHDPDSPSLVGWHDAPAETGNQRTLFDISN